MGGVAWMTYVDSPYVRPIKRYYTFEQITGYEEDATDMYLQWTLHWPGHYREGEQRVMADAIDSHIDLVIESDAWIVELRAKYD